MTKFYITIASLLFLIACNGDDESISIVAPSEPSTETAQTNLVDNPDIQTEPGLIEPGLPWYGGGGSETLLDDCYNEEGQFMTLGMIPVYSDDRPEDLNLQLVSPRPYENLGGIYCYQNKVMIIEDRQGLHIIDNSNPLAPVKEGFLVIEGASQISIRNDVMYTNRGVDLIALDVTDLTDVSISRTIDNVLTDWEWSDDGRLCDQEFAPVDYHGHYIYPHRDSGEIVDWRYDTVIGYDLGFVYNEQFRDTSINYHCVQYFLEDDIALESTQDFAAPVASPVAAVADQGVGQGGSVTRYTITQEHLYVVNDYELLTYNLEDDGQPENTDRDFLTWGSETIFPLGENLFIGTETGMFIYDNSNPSQPEQLSMYSHVVSCDPVVANQDYAFVTLRSGTSCRVQGQTNQLDIIDISDLENPEVVNIVEMDFPKGLGVDGNTLFVCDQDSVKVFDISDALNPIQTTAFYMSNCLDVIPKGGRLLVVGEEEFRQYDYSNLENIQPLSATRLQD